MTMKFILISNLLIVSAYNIDTNHPILYPNSAANADEYQHTRFERNYFGYSVLLHRDSQKDSSWLLIGAPRGNYTRPSRDRVNLKFLNEPGVVYRCGLPGRCIEIEPTVIKDEEIYIHQLDMRGRIRKKQSWFGGAMSIERSSGFLTICAPRTIMNIIFKNNRYVETMQGMCYSDQISSTKLDAELFEIEYFDYSKNTWFDPIHGFSITFASPRGEETINRIIGRPNDNITGSINIVRFKRRNFHQTYTETMEIPIIDNLSQFGYAVTSGYYFDRNQSLYACADPGWDYVGQVAIIDPDRNYMIARLWGTDIGEFFGASLATGDLNKDGLHDLVIGAPHWGNDNGRVHVYLGSPKGEFEAVAILEGASEDALFGYAVASGDLDGDGFNDIIVGAPWEESGVIYIYNGDTSLKDKVRPFMSQRITMQSHGHNLPVNIRTFGFSISEPIDIDSNGYADVAIGAYKSGHVVVLRSKPVVRTNLTIYTVPSTLQRNISDFLITVCVNYYGYDTANTRAFKISLIVDKRYKRTEETLLELVSTEPPVHMCMNTNVTLSDNIQDFIEPITIYATHNFTYNDSSEFCKICPVENKSAKSKSAQTLLLPFDIGCGEDRVCNSNISAIVKFREVRENNSWVIGSNDIILEIRLENCAEPAYLTIIVFIFPEGIVLRSILPFCEEDTDGDNLMVICNVSNPLGMNEQKVVKLDLDMRHLTDSSLHGRILEFSTEIRTRSVNHGTRMIKSWLTLHSEASLSLNGKTIEGSYYLPNMDKDQLNITFQHTYQILKFGATSIDEARFTVNIPVATENAGSLVFLYKPRIYISGKYYNCLSDGIDLVDVQQNELRGETTSDLYAYNSDNNNGTLQNVTHDIFKRDVNDRTTMAIRILQTFYNTTTIKSEISNDNLTESDIIYLNCSTYGVNCSTVYCDLSALKTRQDIGKFAMRLIINATKLRDNFKLSDETKIVKFSTDAYVEIIRPANRIFSVEARRNINLTTEFRNTAKMQKLQLWVVLVSVSLGLILLYIIIIILSMVSPHTFRCVIIFSQNVLRSLIITYQL
ncbi:integrin alpha-4-like isoform X1 [Formica exsecta]|uniref:integrin alpha-4-like isoform X1 n=1 Tax=Formica exsecta TaxID=72781 RepID=UPI001142EB3F|nr:integrin alpha-4-like isoform X1 [Formica exsecta]XP_029667440.1 integrin alpha-4-like isoform X1 [Formica exsecta]XP_029667441.1 integrin alpha-4-like isoform X1 [Formica exsecta]